MRLSLKFAATAVGAALVGGSGFASDADLVLTLKAKAALAADIDLAGLNLLVSVTDKVAVVGGPVPDAALNERIDAVLRKVPGLTEVKAACWVPSGDDPLKKLVGEKLKATPVLPIPVAPPSPVRRLDPVIEPGSAATVTVHRVPVPPGLAGFLLEPVGPNGKSVLPMPTAVEGKIPPTALPVSYAEPAPHEALLFAVKASDPRFARLSVEVKNGTAVIAGIAPTDAAAWALAAAVRKVPGIDRVIVGRVVVRQ